MQFNPIKALRCAAVGLAAIPMLGSSASAVLTDGRIQDPFALGIPDAPYFANRIGAAASGTYGGGLALGDPAGYWGVNVNAGTYSIGFAQKDQFFRKLVFGINAGSVAYNVRYEPDYYSGAIDFYVAPANSFAQSFKALGTSITSVSVRFPAPTTAQATIHQGDVNGPQIGPARFIQGDFPNDAYAAWSAGEVPTTPGQIYTVKFTKADNTSLQVHYSGGRCLMGEDYPDGQSWVDGIIVRNPIRTVIGMDTDGVTSTMNTSVANALQTPELVTTAGQTFTAKGTSVVAASFLVGGFTSDIEVAVFQGPGAGGMGSTQIGPTKWVKPVAWIQRSMATWSPGEVPVTPGNSYYLRIRAINGGSFQIYRIPNEYAGGQFYNGGAASSYDISGLIAEEASTGSATVQKILMNRPTVTARGTNSATFTVNTSPSSSLLVEYGSSLPYTNSINVNAATGHTVTLNGLQPNTLYHVRVTADSAGRRTTRSRDFVFVTDSAAPNLLFNPGFENGNLGAWSNFGARAPVVRNKPASGSGDVGGVKARTGTYYLGDQYSGGAPASRGGAYQVIGVTPGMPLTFRAFLYTYQLEGFSAFQGFMVLGRVGIDPTGGTNPASTSIVWSPLTSGQDWYDASRTSLYQDLAVTATPVGPNATVFVEAGQIRDGTPPNPIPFCIYGFDDLYASQGQMPYVAGRTSELKNLPDGTFVSISNVTCSARKNWLNAAYVQDNDRSSGIRVECQTNPGLGAKLSVLGYLATRPSGEKYIAGATITSETTGTAPVALGMMNSRVGEVTLQGAGPGNVGLLVRSWGKVTATGSGYFMIDDGSTPGRLKVDTNYLNPAAPPAIGTIVQVIGVVSLEGTAPSATPILRARRSADITAL